jgi:hypothetical protein
MLHSSYPKARSLLSGALLLGPGGCGDVSNSSTSTNQTSASGRAAITRQLIHLVWPGEVCG